MKFNLLDLVPGPSYDAGTIIIAVIVAAAVLLAVFLIIRTIRKNKKGK